MISTLLFLLSSLPLPLPQQDRTAPEPEPQAAAVQALLTELHTLASQHPQRLQIEEWGRSRKDRPLLVARVAFPGLVPAEQRPALLLVAGLDGRRMDEVKIAFEQLRRILKAAPDSETARRLSTSTLYIQALANPDGLARRIEGNGAPFDSDRDGQEGEDGPEDLDGDGSLRWMRWKDREGNWIEDSEHPGLMRKADPKKNERGQYRLVREGLDQDGDERFNEDAAGGVLLERNFAQLYPEHAAGAGRYVLSEPESLSLAHFLSKNPSVQLVLSYGGTDNLLAKARKNSRQGRRAPTGYFAEDLWIYDELGKLYRETTKREGKNVDEWPGRFHSWVYAQMGIPCLSTSLIRWSDKTAKKKDANKKDGGKKNDAKKSKDEPGETKESESRPASKAASNAQSKTGGMRSKKKSGKKSDEVEQRAWLEKHFGNKAFLPWRAHRLPEGTLEGKEVEIGGLDPALLQRIPESETEKLTASHLDFLLSLLDRMPNIELAKVTSKQLAPGVLEVEATVSNEGWLPPRIHIATLMRRPVLPRLEAVLGTNGEWTSLAVAQHAAQGNTALISGPRMSLLSAIRGKGSQQKIRWTFRIGKDGPPTLLLRQGNRVLGSQPIPTATRKNTNKKNGGGR